MDLIRKAGGKKYYLLQEEIGVYGKKFYRQAHIEKYDLDVYRREGGYKTVEKALKSWIRMR